jgi:ATP-binding cassette, subfamily B, bacterial
MTEETNRQAVPKTPWQYGKLITKPHAWWLVLAIVVVMVGATLDQATSYLFKLIVDAVESGDSGRVFWLGLAFPVVLFVVQLIFRLSGYLVANLSGKTRKDGYDYLFNYVTKHSHSYFSDRFAGGVHSKIRNVVEGMDQLLPDFIWTYVYSLTALFVTLFLIFQVDSGSAIVFVLLVACLFVVNYKLSPYKEKVSKENAEAKTKMNATMIDMLTNVSTVRQFSRTDHEVNLIADKTTVMKDKNRESWLMTEIILLINSFILFVFSSVMFWLLAKGWSQGEVTTGEFVLVASLVTQLSGTLLFIGRAFNSTARTVGEMKEGLEDLMIPLEVTDTSKAKALEITEGAKIIWSGVSFTYGNSAVFTDFNLVIPAGERIGLVGPSGSGKSTFVSLLLRQHDLTAGSVTINDQNIAEVAQNSLRSAIAVVPQEPSLFHRSIRDNILYGNPLATEDAMIEVAKKAYAHDFIMSLEHGYDTLVGERGVKLSGGQKQRIAIARAMLKNSPILILDEATSALDSESEVEIQRALHILMRGKTVIAVAHRLSTLREMDRIIVLKDGTIVEDGTHEVLKEAGGTYQSLWQHQAGGFLID